MKQKSNIIKNNEYCTEAHVDQLTELSWQLLSSMLYFSFLFSQYEILQTKILIKRFLLSANDAYKGYVEFSQRIMLAREKMIKSKKPVLCSIPSIWMHETFKGGFEATESFYLSLITMRKTCPLYRIELRAVAEAVLELSECPTHNNFRYWRQWFQERGHLQEMYLLNDCIVHYLLKV
ncbi:MAG: hypothetical protein ABI402_15610 [Ferruginibacter sp.]